MDFYGASLAVTLTATLLTLSICFFVWVAGSDNQNLTHTDYLQWIVYFVVLSYGIYLDHSSGLSNSLMAVVFLIASVNFLMFKYLATKSKFAPVFLLVISLLLITTQLKRSDVVNHFEKGLAKVTSTRNSNQRVSIPFGYFQLASGVYEYKYLKENVERISDVDYALEMKHPNGLLSSWSLTTNENKESVLTRPPNKELEGLRFEQVIFFDKNQEPLGYIETNKVKPAHHPMGISYSKETDLLFVTLTDEDVEKYKEALKVEGTPWVSEHLALTNLVGDTYKEYSSKVDYVTLMKYLARVTTN